MPKKQSTENGNTKHSKVEEKTDQLKEQPDEQQVEQPNDEKLNKKIKNIPTLLKKSHFENNNNT